MPANPLSRNFCSTSSTVTSKPAMAATCAMPDPISPQPRTPTFLISITFLKSTLKDLKNHERTSCALVPLVVDDLALSYQLNSTSETLSPGIGKFKRTTPAWFSTHRGDSSNCNCPAAFSD